MKRILITGATGFLGSHLCDKFIKEGSYVIGIDNYITGDEKNIKHLSGDSNFELINHDITNYIDIKGSLDYILHFASPASPIDYIKIPIQTLKVGSLGTHNLLGLARAKKVLNWEPKVNRAKGMATTYNYFKSLTTEELYKSDHKDFTSFIN